MDEEIFNFFIKNNEVYNRHLNKEELNIIFKTYLEKHKKYDEALLLSHIEEFHMEKNSKNRTPQEIENAKNWRQTRRASVCSDTVFPSDFSSISFPKTKETFEFLSNVLVADIPFGLLNPKQKDKLIDIIQCVDIEAGVTLIKEGDSGNTMYVVDEGCFEVFIKNTKIKSLKRGDIFGEIALIHNINRTATVISSVKSKIWVIEQKMFLGLRAFDRNKNKTIVFEGIKSHNLYPDLNEKELISFINTLSFDYLKEDSDVLVNEDEIFFFTLDGIISIDGKEQKVKQKDTVKKSFKCVSLIEGTVMKTRQRKLCF